MKLFLIITLTLFIHIQFANSTWFSLIANSTSGITQFLSKSDLVKKYLSEGFRTKLKTYLTPQRMNTTESEFNKELRDINNERFRKSDINSEINEETFSLPDVLSTTETVKLFSEPAVVSRQPSPSNEELKQEIERQYKKAKNYYSLSQGHKPPRKSYNPFVHMTTPEIIVMNGYHSESHTIVTEDGYILTLHRIPNNFNNNFESHKTVLLHHGLLGSSADWVIPGKEKGLPFLLSDGGYDVWLANVRGNIYSKAHLYLPVDSSAFWNFTFHEVAQHDLPAIIDYIRHLKGPDVKISYIGFSMGTTALFALLSTRPEYNKILRAGYALAPVAYMSRVRGPFRLLARFVDQVEFLYKVLGPNEFLPRSEIISWLAKYACTTFKFEEVICENALFVFCGHDPKEFNRTLLPVILGHVPAGTSTKTLIHYAQEIEAQGKFQQFDYGWEGNMRQYNQKVPPLYPLEKITLPIALFSAENDWLAGEHDVENLHDKLVNPIEHYKVPLKQFTHLDFMWAVDAPKLVYERLLQLLKSEIKRKKTVGNDVQTHCDCPGNHTTNKNQTCVTCHSSKMPDNARDIEIERYSHRNADHGDIFSYENDNDHTVNSDEADSILNTFYT